MKLEVVAASLLSAYFVYKLIETEPVVVPVAAAAPSSQWFIYLALIAIFIISEFEFAAAASEVPTTREI